MQKGRMLAMMGAFAVVWLQGCATQQVIDEGNQRVEQSESAKMAGKGNRLLRIARASRAAGDYQSAAELYQQAITQSENDPAPWLEYADFLTETGNTRNSITLLENAVRRMPEEANLYRQLAQTYLRISEYSTAVRVFNRGLKLAPEDTRFYSGKGAALDLAGRHDAAQEAYYAGLEMAPNNAALLTNLGMSLILSKQYDQAIDVLNRVPRGTRAYEKAQENLKLAQEMAATAMPAPMEPVVAPEPVAPVEPVKKEKIAPREEAEGKRELEAQTVPVQQAAKTPVHETESHAVVTEENRTPQKGEATPEAAPAEESVEEKVVPKVTMTLQEWQAEEEKKQKTAAKPAALVEQEIKQKLLKESTLDEEPEAAPVETEAKEPVSSKPVHLEKEETLGPEAALAQEPAETVQEEKKQEEKVRVNTAPAPKVVESVVPEEPVEKAEPAAGKPMEKGEAQTQETEVWYADLGEVFREVEGKALWRDIQPLHPALNPEHCCQFTRQHRKGGFGGLHMRAGPFASYDEVGAICSALTEKKLTCRPVRVR